ncbi:MAG: hypothetical protein DDT34_00380 [Firmicutes bacterium]|nr:hypothetical protein [Bacillota bacterium]MBT9157768.1 hypothetical protein [Bacillota bacterium]
MKTVLQNQRGQALVELALVLPILLLILMAIVDMGRMYHGLLSVTTAARAGARQASLGQADAVIQAAAFAAAAPLETTRLRVHTTPSQSLRFAGTAITVVVEYQLAILTPGMQNFFPNPLRVSGRAVMARE